MPNKLKPWDTYHTKGIRKKYLFRYCQDRKVKSFLESKALYLTKMSRFDDKLEGISTYDITELRAFYETCFSDIENEINPELISEWNKLKETSKEQLIAIYDRISKTQNNHFVSCWFNSDRESDGMWRFYGRDNGFAIRVGRKELQEKVKKSVNHNIDTFKQGIVAGRINYQDFPRVIEKEEESRVRYLAFRKDESFSHEKEYRVVMVDLTEEAISLGHRMYKILEFDELDIIIIVHPKMSDSGFEKYKKLFESYGENIKVIKSELEPFYKLPDRIKELNK